MSNRRGRSQSIPVCSNCPVDEAQLQTAICNLSTIIEPVIIVLVGGIVGFVYIAFFIALFSAGGF